jgi:hypothetical protein
MERPRFRTPPGMTNAGHATTLDGFAALARRAI